MEKLKKFQLFPLKQEESQNKGGSLLFQGFNFPQKQSYHFWGCFEKLGSQILFKDGLRLLIKERKNPTKRKPKFYLGFLAGKKFSYISSLYPCEVVSKGLLDKGITQLFLMDYMDRDYFLALSENKAYFWEILR